MQITHKNVICNILLEDNSPWVLDFCTLKQKALTAVFWTILSRMFIQQIAMEMRSCFPLGREQFFSSKQYNLDHVFL